MDLLNKRRESNFNTDHKNNSWCKLLMHIIQASQKEIKKAISRFQILFWILCDFMGSIWFANELKSTYQDYTYFCHFPEKILHCPPFSVSLVLFFKYFIHMPALRITLLDFSLLIKAFLKKKKTEFYVFFPLCNIFSNYFLSVFQLTRDIFTECF